MNFKEITKQNVKQTRQVNFMFINHCHKINKKFNICKPC